MLHARTPAHAAAVRPARHRAHAAAIALLAIACAHATDATGAWTPLTLGGEGGMFAQAISPVDPNLMMVTCDMGASYVTRDGGRNWLIIDCRQLGFMGGGDACPPVFHPTDANTIYAYGQKNGGQPSLLITHDKGSTWAVQSSAWGGAQITALYQDRGNPALMVAGVNGVVAYSNDEGRTWANASGFAGRAVHFFIDGRSSATSRTCYVGADTGAWRSTDGGRSWSTFNAGLGATNLRSLTGGANASALALFATDVNYGVWRSVNGGAWSAVGSAPTGAQPWQVSMAEVDPDVVYLTTNNGGFEPTTTMLYKSVDRGATWDPGVYQFHVGTGNVEWSWETYDRPAHRWDDGTLVRNLMVSQSDPNCVIAGDWARCVTTRDGGASWQQMTSAYADSGTPAAGKRWRSNGLNVTCAWFYQISPQNPNLHYVGFSDVALMRSEDAGQTWSYSAVGDPWDNTVYQLAFDPDVGGTMWAACSLQHDISMWGGNTGPRAPGGICISTDSGRTWTPQRNGLPADSQNVPAVSVIVDPTDKSLYAGFYGDWIYRSTDKGTTWTRCACSGLYAGTNNNHNLWKLVAHADGTLFAMVEGKLIQNSAGWDYPDPGAVFRSRDHGATWTNLTTNVAGGVLYNPQGFAVDPVNSAIVYLAASNAKYPHDNQSGFYKTTDGGATWTRPALPWGDAFANGVQVDPADRNTLYFMSSGATFVSHDAGATWADAVPTAPYTGCHGIAVDHATNALYLATVGVGAIRGTLAPVSIATPTVTNITANGATVTWTTNVASSSQVDYGTSTGYGSSTALDGNRVTSHSVALGGLTGGTTYHVRARSIDGSGAIALSGDVAFTTGSGTTATAPTITSQPASVAVTAGQAATFSVAATGTAPLAYQWRRNGAAIGGATGASYTTPATTTADNGALFSVVVSNGAGSATSANATLTVNAAPTPVATPYGGSARAIPGSIEAEDFDDGGEGVAFHDVDVGNQGGAYRSTDVDIRAGIDSNGAGYQVGWFVAGEWMQYTTNAADAGTYTAAVRVANGDVGGTFHLTLDGVDVTGPMSTGNTGGWDTFVTLTHGNVAIAARRHALRIVCDSGAVDVNWLSFTADTTTSTGTPGGGTTTPPPPTTSVTGSGGAKGGCGRGAGLIAVGLALFFTSRSQRRFG